MGVERWVYEKLGKPPFQVRDPVRASLHGDAPVDWIRLSPTEGGSELPGLTDHGIAAVRLRGGCDMAALASYFQLTTDVACLESNYLKDPVCFVRKDSSCSLVEPDGHPREVLDACERIGLSPGDLASSFLAPARPGTVLVYSGWGDALKPVHRHRRLDFDVGLHVPGLVDDIGASSSEQLDDLVRRERLGQDLADRLRTIVAAVKEDFVYAGLVDEATLSRWMGWLFAHVPDGALLVVLVPLEPEGGCHERVAMYNACLRSLAAGRENVVLVQVADSVHGSDEVRDAVVGHFDRLVYYRLFQDIVAQVRLRQSRAPAC